MEAKRAEVVAAEDVEHLAHHDRRLSWAAARRRSGSRGTCRRPAPARGPCRRRSPPAAGGRRQRCWRRRSRRRSGHHTSRPARRRPGVPACAPGPAARAGRQARAGGRAGRKIGSGRLVAPEIVGRLVEQRHVARREHEALAGEPDRRRHHRGAGQGAVTRARRLQPGGRAGNADAEPALGRASLRHIALRVEEHALRRGERRLFAEIQERRPPVGQVQQHEPAAAKVAARRIHHGERVADRDRRIHRVAAGFKHLQPGRRGQRLRRDHHEVARRHRRPVSRPRRPRNEHQGAEQQGADHVSSIHAVSASTASGVRCRAAAARSASLRRCACM